MNKFRTIVSAFRNSKSTLIFLSLFSMVNIFVMLIAPFLTSRIFSGESLEYYNIVIIMSLIVMSYLFQMIVVYLNVRFSRRFKILATKNYYQNLAQVSYDDYLDKKPTYFIDRINTAVNSLSEFIVNFFSSLVTNFFVVVIILVWVYTIDIKIFLILLFVIPLNIYGYKALNKKLVRKSSELQKVCSNNFGEILNVFSQVDFIKQNHDSKKIVKGVEGNIIAIENSMYDVNKFASFSHQTINLINLLINNVVIILVALVFLQNQIEISSVVVVIMLASIYFKSIGALVSVNLDFRNVQGSLEFIDTELIANQENDGDIEINQISEIAMKIDSLYIKNKKILSNIRLDCKKGDVIGLIGPSGSGKSSLVKALLKFRFTEGVFVNGRDINLITNRSLRERISYFSQNIPLISKSVRENINFGTGFDESKINEILRLPFLKKLFNDSFDLDTMILENGANVSGGEKQKIAIIRAFLEHNDVLILDEVTSSIDHETAKEIIRNLIERNSNSIIFIISHDAKLYNFMSRVYEINEGLLIKREK